jgi:hypothetical protein
VASDADELAARLKRIEKLGADFHVGERTFEEARRLAVERNRVAAAENALIRSKRQPVKCKRHK